MKVRYTVTGSFSRGVAEKELGERLLFAQRWLTNRVILDSEPFVPMASGTLAGSPRRASNYDKGIIYYDTPYARRLYYGVTFNFSRTEHPKATHHWFRSAYNRWGFDWLKKVKKIINQGWRGVGMYTR